MSTIDSPTDHPGLFSFPNPVNDVAARTVATGVVAVALLFVVTGWGWVLLPLTYGFIARVLTGPTLSPLGQLVTRVVTPALGLPEKLVPGPPKRFAQGIGATLSVSAAVLALGFGAVGAAYVLLGFIVVAAPLESVFGFCLGCTIFAALMRVGVIPQEVCERCDDIWGGAAEPA